MRPLRWVRRGLEALDIVVSHAADTPSRRRLLAAYVALVKRRWNPSPFDIRLCLEGRTVDLKLRQRDIYVLGEILYDKVYGRLEALSPNPTVIDAGANIGVFSVWLSCAFPGAAIHCFEPEPENFNLLEYNLKTLGGQCHQVALGSTSGTAALHVSSSVA